MIYLSKPQILVLVLLLTGIYILAPRELLSSSSRPDVEIVLSLYREDPILVSQQIKSLREILAHNGWTSRVVVYSKDESMSFDQIESLQRKLTADSLITLPNKGREGGTFLHHIISEYDKPAGFRFSPSRHILFAQSLLENQELLVPRISALRTDTDFMSLGRYANCLGARDSHGQKRHFPRMREIYSMFTGEIYPNTGQLCTYKGQFIVSRRQILRNQKHIYQHLLKILEAPEGHWIYEDPEDHAWAYRGHKSSPSSPFFGHALERSWPAIFNCIDTRIADSCSAGRPELCQCKEGH